MIENIRVRIQELISSTLLKKIFNHLKNKGMKYVFEKTPECLKGKFNIKLITKYD